MNTTLQALAHHLQQKWPHLQAHHYDTHPALHLTTHNSSIWADIQNTNLLLVINYNTTTIDLCHPDSIHHLEQAIHHWLQQISDTKNPNPPQTQT